MARGLGNTQAARKKVYLGNAPRRAVRGYGEEYGPDGKRRRRTNRRRGFLSQMSDGYRGV